MFMKGERLVNDHNFECTNLQELEVEQIFGFFEEDSSHSINMIILKLKEKELWQRLFLDAGLGFWEEWDEESTFLDYDEDPFIDLAEKYSLKGQLIKKIQCKGSYNELSFMVFKIGSCKLKYEFVDKSDCESETILTKL